MNVLKSVEKRTPQVIKGLLNETPDWYAFLEHKEEMRLSPMARIESPTLCLIYSDGKSKDKFFKRFNGLKEFSDLMNDAFGENFLDEPVFIISESTKTKSGFPKHTDVGDQFHWNCIGSSLWTFWADSELTFQLDPGDIMYIPHGMQHGVVSLTEQRAGIVYTDFGVK